MAVKFTGRGKYQVVRNGDGDITVQLYNFDINGSDVKEDHKQILRGTVLEILKGGGSVAILGHASTTGASDYDQTLSEGRADQVLRFLRGEGGSKFFVNKNAGRGKQAALAITGADNKEDEKWRTVWVRVWTKTNPPPDIGVAVNPSVPLPKNPLISEFSDDLSLVSGVLSIVDLGIDFAGLAAAGIVTGVAGLALTVVGGIIALPALWASVDALAEANGKMQGYADAMQDMAEAFSDNSLDRKPLRDWPAIPEPKPHLPAGSAPSVGAQFWRQGQQWGCNQARIDVLQMQVKPVEMDAKLKDGSTRKVKVNGKVMLRGAWVATKGEVSPAIMKVFNERLIQAGKKPFPTR